MNTEPVARLEDIPNLTGREFLVSGQAVAVWNIDGEVFATSARCPHADAPLCMSIPSEEGIITCAMHGWSFNIKTGQSIAPPNRHLKTYPVTVKDSQIFVQLTSA